MNEFKEFSHSVVELPGFCANQDSGKYFAHSQIFKVIILPYGATKPADWKDYSDWMGVIDNEDETGQKAKEFYCIAGIEQEIIKEALPRGQSRMIKRNFILSGKIPNLHELNYNFFRCFQNRINAGFWIWFETVGGNFYGGQSGIFCNITDAVFPLKEDIEEYEHGIFEFEFNGLNNPERIISPFITQQVLEVLVEDDLEWIITDDFDEAVSQ